MMPGGPVGEDDLVVVSHIATPTCWAVPARPRTWGT
jgi:hypothetical protein